MLTRYLLVHDCSCWACHIRLSSRYAIYDTRMVSYAGREGHCSCKSVKGWQSSTREGHGRNLQKNLEVVEVVCFRAGIRGKQCSVAYVAQHTKERSSCLAALAGAMATSPSGSSLKATRSLIGTSCPPAPRSSRRPASYFGVSFRIIRAAGLPGY